MVVISISYEQLKLRFIIIKIKINALPLTLYFKISKTAYSTINS